MKKRIFSLALASVMTLSLSVSAFATEELPDSAELIGEGSTAYIDLKVTSTSLPTDAAFDFVVDPLGLAAIATGGSSLVQELQGGGILAKNVPTPFVNKSSYPVKVTAAVQATGDATFKDKAADVEESGADKTNALLYVMPSATNVLTGNNFTEADKAIPVLANAATSLTFGLPAAKFAVTNTGGTYATNRIASTERGTALAVGGYVNSQADWTDFSGTSGNEIGISVTFTFVEQTDAEYAALTNSTTVTAYGISGAAITAAFTPAEQAENVGPFVEEPYQSWDGEATLTLTVDLGEGDLAATAVDFPNSTMEIILNGAYHKVTLPELAEHFTSSGTVLTIKKSLFEVAEINEDTDLLFTIKFEGSDREVMAIFHKPVATL